jgi:hypothetical protein
VTFNSTLRYIDDVLSININQFHLYVDSIYPNELEIKDTTDCSTSASYLDILMKLNANGKLSIQLYNKQDYFNFLIVSFPYLCSNIPSGYGVYISKLIRYARACSTYNQFFFYWRQSTDKQVNVPGFVLDSLTGSIPQILWS